MIQSSSYEVQGRQAKIRKLKKAIYSLKESPRVWFDKFSIVIAHYELRRGSSDHSIFIRYSSIGTIIFLVYVNYIIVTGDNHQGIIQLKAYLSSHFSYKRPFEVFSKDRGCSLSKRSFFSKNIPY